MNNKKSVLIILSLVIVTAVIIGAFFLENNNDVKVTYLEASWAYSYEDVEELSDNSDIIAVIKVGDVEESYTDEEGLPFIIFNVEVENAIYGCEENEDLLIFMTGSISEDEIMELIDDPLLNEGDEFLIFAQENDNGTYTILSGPQGRLKYEDGKVSSLNYVYTNVEESNDYAPIDVNNEDINNVINEIEQTDKFK